MIGGLEHLDYFDIPIIYCMYNIYIYISYDWCFGTWLLCFHSLGNVIIPTDEVHHFSEG